MFCGCVMDILIQWNFLNKIKWARIEKSLNGLFVFWFCAGEEVTTAMWNEEAVFDFAWVNELMELI